MNTFAGGTGDARWLTRDYRESWAVACPRKCSQSRTPWWSLIGAAAGWAHLHELWIELAENFDQVGLRGHDGVDVLAGTWHFTEAGGDFAICEGRMDAGARRAA